MRYSQAHAAKSGSVPFMLRGPKSVRTILATAVAGALGFVPAVMIASPAQAIPLTGYTLTTTNSGTEGSTINYVLTRTGTGSSMAASTLTWALTGAGSPPATTDADFNSTSGSVTFAADTLGGTASQTIAVSTYDDSLDEDSENFVLTVTSAGGDTIQGTGTITDNDDPPSYTLMLDNDNPSEDAGYVTVSARLATPSGKSVSIPFSTVDGTAHAGQDYTATSGTLTVTANNTDSNEVQIPILDDVLYEDAKQTFDVKTTGATGATGTPTATVTINDNEAQSALTITAESAVEGGTVGLPVTLDPPSERAVTVNYSSADGTGPDISADVAATDGTATAGTDYTAASGTLTFPGVTGAAPNVPGVAAASKLQTVSVRTTPDTIYEIDPEDFHVTLASPTVAKLSADYIGTGHIEDDDGAPVASLVASSFNEGNAGTVAQTYTVKLSKAAGRKITVKYATNDNISGGAAATQGQDFVATNGTLTFAAGETTKTFTVNIVGDTMLEPDEFFNVNLSSDDLSQISDTDVMIKNDDAKPTYTVSPMSMKEGETGQVVVFPIKLSAPVGQAVSVAVTATDGTATHSGDLPGDTDYYLTPSGTATATIPAGQTTGYVYFLVNGDSVYENDEQMTLSVTPNATYVAGGQKSATLTLTNDDAAPSLDIVSVTGNEGDAVQVTGVTNGATQVQVPLNVTFRGGSVNGSVAAAAADFVDQGTVGVIIPGFSYSGTTVDVGDPVQLVDDTVAEPAETIVVSGSGFGGAGTVKSGALTIAASDSGTTPPPAGGAPTIMAPASVTGSVPVSVTGVAAAGATVELWGAPMAATKAPLVKLLTTTANATTGAYSFSRLISSGYRFQTAVGTLMSAEKSVSVVQSPLFIVGSPSSGTVSLAVQGNPRGPGQTVIIQRWVNGAWVNTTWRGTTGSDNLWKATAKVPAKSTWTLRAFVAGYTPTGLLPGYSPQQAITIK